MLKWPEPKKDSESLAEFYARVHSWALSIFNYQMDQVVWGEPDHWDSRIDLENLFRKDGVINGDCDDFAQLCRHALSPIPSRLVLCYVETGDYHAVAETTEGWVFDVRRHGISTWDDLIGSGYKKDVMGPLCDPQIPNPSGLWYMAT